MNIRSVRYLSSPQIISPITRIVQLTDPHLLSSGQRLMGLDTNARFAEVLEAALTLSPDALVLTGDFCGQDPSEEVYQHLRPQLDATGVPYFLTPGNHDSRELMRQHFRLPGEGDTPIYGRVSIAGRPYYFLDTAPGSVSEAQLDWLESQLDPNIPAEIFMHHPPIELGVRFMDERYKLRDTERLLSILTRGEASRTIFCGHYHSYRTVHRENLIVHLCPPTSFFIHPEPDGFRLEELPPAYQLIEYAEGNEVVARVVPRFLVPSRSA